MSLDSAYYATPAMPWDAYATRERYLGADSSQLVGGGPGVDHTGRDGLLWRAIEGRERKRTRLCSVSDYPEAIQACRRTCTA